LDEASERSEYLASFGEKLPAAIDQENQSLVERLQASVKRPVVEKPAA
jgi:hypothetical protein